MKEHGARKHLRESVPLVKGKIEKLKAELHDLEPILDIVTIGDYVYKQIQIIQLEEKLIRMLEELGE